MDAAIDKLFSVSEAFDHPVTVTVLIGLGVVLLLVPLVVEGLSRSGRLDTARRSEIHVRYASWLVMIPVMLAPVLLGPGCTILDVDFFGIQYR